MSASLPVPMLQLCGYEGSPYDRVFLVELEGRDWLMATNGSAALLVAAGANPTKGVERFSGNVERAFGGSTGPAFSIAWHDLQGWLRDRVERELCPECGGKPTVPICYFCEGEPLLEPRDPGFVGGAHLDRNLFARFLAPVRADRVVISPGLGDAAATCFRAPDDSWRVYVMPIRRDGDEAVLPWLPLGMQEAA